MPEIAAVPACWCINDYQRKILLSADFGPLSSCLACWLCVLYTAESDLQPDCVPSARHDVACYDADNDTEFTGVRGTTANSPLLYMPRGERRRATPS